MLTLPLALTSCGSRSGILGSDAVHDEPASAGASGGMPVAHAGAGGWFGFGGSAPTSGEAGSAGEDAGAAAGMAGAGGSAGRPACEGTTTFGARNFETDDFATGLDLVDLDADGELDLATAHEPGQINLRLSSFGVLGPPKSYQVGESARALAHGDMNTDGKVDLVVTNIHEDEVRIAFKLYDGSFGPGPGYPTENFPTFVLTSDLNHDDLLDVVTVSSEAGMVRSFLGDGKGLLGEGQSFPVDDHLPWMAAAGDLNGDQNVDLVVSSNRSGGVSTLLGNGDGTFQPAVPVVELSETWQLALEDLNGDDALDIAVVSDDPRWGGPSPVTSTVTLLFGHGDATFAAPVTIEAGPGRVRALTASDLDEDGALDLVFGDYNYYDDELSDTTTDVHVLMGNGDGTFQARRDYTIGTNPVFLAVGDLNGDGKKDLAGMLYTSVSVLYGNGDGTFESGRTLDVHPGDRGQHCNWGCSPGLALADLNGDQRRDLLSGAFHWQSVVIFPGNGDGTFGYETVHVSDDGGGSPSLGDLNGDGLLDLVTSGRDRQAHSLLGNGDGTFQAPRAISGVRSNAGLFDVNDDEVLDLVTACASLLGNNDGTFGPESLAFPVSGCDPPYMSVPRLGDVDGDGTLDLAYHDRGADDGVIVLRGKGDGTFEEPLRIMTTGYGAVTLADFDGDLLDDLVLSSYQTGGLALFSSNGDGTFQAARFIATVTKPSDVVASDLNRDDNQDLVVLSQDEDTVTIIFGDGDGSFDAPEVYTASSPISVVVGDINVDEEPDFVTAAGWSDSVSVFYGVRHCYSGSP